MITPTRAALTTFLESLSASGAQLPHVHLQTVRYRLILLILHVATVPEHIRSTGALLLQGALVAFCASFLSRYVGR